MRTKNFAPRLPRLPKHLAREKNESTAESLLKLLRRIARSNQTAQPQTFYTFRAVAENFGQSLSLISRVFSQLEEEGLIGRVRGSRTVLHGLKYDRDLHVRAVVGLPASIFRFAALLDYRAFLTCARRELRRRGFMPAAVFFERHETRDGLLAEYLLDSKPDAVIWFSPDRTCRETVATLRDAGVRLIGVRDGGLASIPCRYEIRRENALRTILRDWRGAGLQSVALVSEPRGRSEAEEERWRAWSEDELLPAETVLLELSRLKRSLTLLGRHEKRGIVLAGSAAALCALREPEAFAELMRKRRVALFDGPISMLFANVPEAPVDLVTVNWKMVAERIVGDLITQAVWSESESLVFHAKPEINVPLQKFCHEI